MKYAFEKHRISFDVLGMEVDVGTNYVVPMSKIYDLFDGVQHDCNGDVENVTFFIDAESIDTALDLIQKLFSVNRSPATDDISLCLRNGDITHFVRDERWGDDNLI